MKRRRRRKEKKKGAGGHGGGAEEIGERRVEGLVEMRVFGVKVDGYDEVTEATRKAVVRSGTK